MFRHIFNSIKSRVSAMFKAKQTKIEVTQIEIKSPFKESENSGAGHEKIPEWYLNRVANSVGEGFPQPWLRKLPEGYFWKQDQASDLWRIYRDAARRYHG